MARESVSGTGQGGLWRGASAALAILALAMAGTASAQTRQPVPAPPPLGFADYADLTESAPIVAVVEVRGQALVEPARAPGLAPGKARLFIEARTGAVLAARMGLGESISFLADVPLLPNGKPPKLKKQRFLIYAAPVPGQPAALQLVSPGAMVAATPESEARAREVIALMVAPDAPPKVTGIREAISVAGNLAGESETQLFLDTARGDPVSLSVLRRPGMAPEWGVSWTEIVDQAARPPRPGSVEWYRLACFLPRELPAQAFLQADRAARTRAEADYRFVLGELGPCDRHLA